jgi:hypothetical protein
MNNKYQEKKMKELALLSRRNLGYIFGDSEREVAGDKKVWLNTGKAFLRQLARDLGLTESKVWANPGGIAINGESTLMGMWSEGNGIYVELTQALGGCGCVMYRDILTMKDYSGGTNNWVSPHDFETLSYDRFVERLERLRYAEPTAKIA